MKTKSALAALSLLTLAIASLWPKSALCEGPEMIEFADDGGALPTPTGMRAANGEEIHAIPAVVLTARDGRQAVVPLSATDEPGPWRDLGFGVAALPGIQVSTTDWISVSATVVFGTLSTRALDPSQSWGVRENRYRGASIEGELGYRTAQIGVGYSEARFVTILWIIPVPYEVSWNVHAMVLHARRDGHGLQSGDDYVGVEGKIGFNLIRLAAGIYRRLDADQSDGRRYLLRAGVGIGF